MRLEPLGGMIFLAIILMTIANQPIATSPLPPAAVIPAEIQQAERKQISSMDQTEVRNITQASLRQWVLAERCLQVLHYEEMYMNQTGKIPPAFEKWEKKDFQNWQESGWQELRNIFSSQKSFSTEELAKLGSVPFFSEHEVDPYPMVPNSWYQRKVISWVLQDLSKEAEISKETWDKLTDHSWDRGSWFKTST